jgi:hypothetical protein
MAESSLQMPLTGPDEGAITFQATTDLAAIPGLQELWHQTRGDPSVCIAILDGPIDLTHPALAEAQIKEVRIEDAVCESAASTADHGTHVASIIFGNPYCGVRGVAPQCRGLAIPIFEYANDGSLKPCSQERLAKAINLAIDHGADVINISAGQLTPSGGAGEALTAAVERAVSKALIVAAAGNDGCECLHVPGALPSVLAVGAMNTKGEPLPSSNWGAAYQQQGILAPGEGILGASAGNGVRQRTGTSFATAIVSSVAGLLMSSHRKHQQPATPQMIRESLLKNAIGCEASATEDCDRLLVGRLNIPPLMDENKNEKGANAVSNQLPTNVSQENLMATNLNAPPMNSGLQNGGNIGASCADVTASACGCGGPGALAYVIGKLSYDFESDARMDSIQQAMRPAIEIPNNPQATSTYDLLRHLLGYKEIQLCCKFGTIKEIGFHEVDGKRYIKITIPDGATALEPEDNYRQIAIMDVGERRSADDPFKSSVLNVSRNAQTKIRLIPESGSSSGGSSSSSSSGGTGYKKYEFYLDDWEYSSSKEYKLDCAKWYLPTKCTEMHPHGRHPQDVKALTWTLMRGSTVLYAVQPRGPFAEEAYEQLAEFLLSHQGWARDYLNLYYFDCGERMPWPFAWDPCFNMNPSTKTGAYAPPLITEGSERLALPGHVSGQVMLKNCVTASVLYPDMRGAYDWSRPRLLKALADHLDNAGEEAALRQKIGEVLERLDEEVRNPGLSSSDRALNFASTQQLHLFRLIEEDLEGPFEVDTVLPPRPSDHCRPGSDCWDVEIAFFDPGNMHAASIIARQSVDVSDVVPVMIDEPKRFRRRS